jgi:hypothetical protein
LGGLLLLLLGGRWPPLLLWLHLALLLPLPLSGLPRNRGPRLPPLLLLLLLPLLLLLLPLRLRWGCPLLLLLLLLLLLVGLAMR